MTIYINGKMYSQLMLDQICTRYGSTRYEILGRPIGYPKPDCLWQGQHLRDARRKFDEWKEDMVFTRVNIETVGPDFPEFATSE